MVVVVVGSVWLAFAIWKIFNNGVARGTTSRDDDISRRDPFDLTLAMT